MADRRVEYMRITDIEPALRNPKGHDADAIAASVDRFGLAELPLVDERTGRLVAGHGRVDGLIARRRATELPPDGVRVDDDGEWLVPVIRGWSSPTDEDAEAYLVASNRLTVLGEWDEPGLADLLTDLRDRDAALLAVTGFTDDDIAKMLTEPTVLPDALAPGDSGPSGGLRTVGTGIGDLWVLGRHRLFCGDATNPDHVDRLLDAVDGEPDLIHTAAPGTDPSAAADVFRFLTVLLPDALHVWWGAHRYSSAAGMPDSPCWLLWDTPARGDSDDVDLAWTSHDGRTRRYPGPKPKKKPAARLPRPDAVAAWAMDTVDKDRFRATVLDPFAGNGWTLLAAHTTNRTCAAMDVSPERVDALCRRFQQETGMKPERLHDDGTREVVDFTGLG